MQSQQQQFAFVLFVLCNIISISFAIPSHYDQRQDGKVNVHANLEDFVIIIAPISDTASPSSFPPSPSSSPPLQQFDTSELSLSALLEAFEFRKNLLAKNKLQHKSDKITIEAIPEDSENQQVNQDEYSKATRSLKTKPEKKKASAVTELTLIGDGIENCGPGRFRDRSGICQFDGSQRN